jgi:hypothetical protein
MKKPARPHPEFPHFPHANCQWAKKIKPPPLLRTLGMIQTGALAKWLEQNDDLPLVETRR